MSDKTPIKNNGEFELENLNIAPVGKLDADQYSAIDLDGVTEGVFGSGNMAYASLQAAQTDTNLETQSGEITTDTTQLDTDRPLIDASGSNIDETSDGNFASSTVGSISASQLSSDDGTFAPGGSGLNLNEGINTSANTATSAVRSQSAQAQNKQATTSQSNNQTNSTGLNGSDGADGTNGQDGVNGTGDGGDGGDIITNITNIELVDVTNTLITLNTIIKTVKIEIENIFHPLLDGLGLTGSEGDLGLDLDLGIAGIDITDTVENLTETLGINTSEIPVIGAISETLDDTLLTPVESVAGTIIDSVIASGVGNLSENIVLNPVEDLIGDLDIDLGIATDLFGDSETDNANGDTDITLLGDADLTDIDIAGLDIDVNLDAIEEITGDIDINLGAGLDILGDTADPLINDGAGGSGQDTILSTIGDAASETVADIIAPVIGDIDEINIEQSLNILSPASEPQDDTDLDAGIDITGANDLGGLEAVTEPLINTATETLDVAQDIALDPVEDIVGDLDVGLDLATDLLGNSETDNDAGDNDITLSNDNDLIDNDLTGIETDIAIDPVEDIIGDVDLDIDAATDILGDTADSLIDDGAGGSGQDTLLSDVGDAISDIAEEITAPVLGESEINTSQNIDLLNSEDTSNAEGDSDLEVSTDIEIAGIETPDVEIDVPLDIVEEITGDIDLELDVALDLLNTGGTQDNTNETTNDNSWTESTIGDGLFDDITGSVSDGMGDILPDPSGTVAEGLGVLNVEPEIDVGSLGGLFG